jgi:hypothetical protein
MIFYIIQNMNQNYNKIPCFAEMKIKTTKQTYGISKQNLWFSITSTHNSFYSSQNYVFKNVSLFQNLPLWVVPSLFIMIQNQQKFKIQTNKVP